MKSSLISGFVLLFCVTATAAALPQSLSYNQSDTSAPSDENATALYRQGLTEMEDGNYEKAAEIWAGAPELLETPDFRIAQSLVRMVTRREMKAWYEQAGDIYRWALSPDTVREEWKQPLNREVELLQSILGYGTFRDWSKMVDREDPEVFDRLKGFWKSMDPTPMTDYNERLLEHWERVSYAEKNYNMEGSKGMDDRADTYIRYGEPDVLRQGQLMYNSGTVNALLSERMTQPFTNTRGNPFRNYIRGAQQFNMETNIRTLHDYPRYEIWIYERLTEDPDNTVFIFGTGSGSNHFQRKNSVEEFIPNSAFSQTERNTFMNLIIEQERGEDAEREEQQMSMFDGSNEVTEAPEQYVTPAVVMQIMYYEQLAALDPYFGKAYNNMINRYTDKTVRLSKSLAREFESINGNNLIELQSKAPEEKSRHLDAISEVPISYYAYRFLDEGNNPYVRLYVRNHPSEAVYFDHMGNRGAITDDLWNRYSLIAGLQANNEEGEAVMEETSRFVLGPDARRGVVTDYWVPYEMNSHSLVVSSEVHKRWEPDTALAGETPFKSSLKGVGKQRLALPEPLNRRELEMGDILIGYSTDSRETPGEDFAPFQIAHEGVIPKGYNFNIYYELYHLQQNASDRASFTFTYTIESRDNSGFLFFGGGGEELSITLNNETFDSRYTQVLDIETAGLERGEYRLRVEAVDQNSGESVSRTIDFRVE